MEMTSASRQYVDRETMKMLCEKAFWPWLCDVLVDWIILVLAIVGAGYYHHPITYVLAVVVIGNRQHALAILLHEGAHYTIHSNKKINDLLTNFFCSGPLLMPLKGYRDFHFAHHRHAGTEDDPELLIKSRRSPFFDLPLRKRHILRNIITHILGIGVHESVLLAIFAKPKNFRDLFPVLLWHVCAITFLYFVNALWVLLLWYASSATFFWLFFNLRVWIEHQGTSDTHRIHLNIWLRHLIAPHNFWYHWEHHNYAAVPCQRLGKLRALIPEPKIVTFGELLDIYRNSRSIKSGAVLKVKKR